MTGLKEQDWVSTAGQCLLLHSQLYFVVNHRKLLKVLNWQTTFRYPKQYSTITKRSVQLPISIFLSFIWFLTLSVYILAMNTSLQNLAMSIIFPTGNPSNHVLENAVSGRYSIYHPPQRRGGVYPKAVCSFSNQSSSAIMLNEKKMFSWNSSEKKTPPFQKNLQHWTIRILLSSCWLQNLFIILRHLMQSWPSMSSHTGSPLVSSYRFLVTQNNPLCNIYSYFNPDSLYYVTPKSCLPLLLW